MNPRMNPTATEYAAADRPLTVLLDSVPATSWANPSPCPDWTARDVVGHLIQTQRDFLGSHGVDLGAAPDVASDPAGAWRRHAARVAEALADDAVPDRKFEGFFGPTTVGAALEQFYIWDMVVHRWDVARAVGADAGLTDAEIGRMEAGADSFGPALYMDGICQPAVDVPADADRRTRVLARLGRVA
jgi:uncharacterized protein (TIGR03086 family)